VICDELRQQKTFLEVQLVDAQAPGK
jgi:hypothetical protein